MNISWKAAWFLGFALAVEISVFSAVQAAVPPKLKGGIIGIAGGSGSGKTTLAKTLKEVLQSAGHVVCHVSEDWFYLSRADLPADLLIDKAKNFYNVDHPAAFDLKLIAEKLDLLKQGKTAQMPIYIFEVGRSTETRPLGPCDTIIYEGIHAFYDPSIRNLFDLKVFVDLDDAVRLKRRLIRDERERSTSQEKTQLMWDEFVRPMFDQFAWPLRELADITISGLKIDNNTANFVKDEFEKKEISRTPSFIIGISGGSASGKSTLARELQEKLNSPEQPACIVSEDRYYISKEIYPEDLILTEPDFLKGLRNYDHPRAFDVSLISRQLNDLKNGGSVAAPIYNYATSLRDSETQVIGPCRVIIYEGIHTFYHPSVRDQLNLKIFVDLDDQTRMNRRFSRDEVERGVVRPTYDHIVRPMYEQYVDPMREHADLLISGETVRDHSDEIVARVKSEMSEN